MDYLVNIQQARRSAREARVIESDLTSNERRIERNEMEASTQAASSLDMDSEDEMLSKLVQLAEMRESGILSEEEFVMAKTKLLKL